MHLVYPPKLCITIVFDFSWDGCNTLGNLETLVMQNCEEENKVHYGLCESSDYKRCKIKLSDRQRSFQVSQELCAGQVTSGMWIKYGTSDACADHIRQPNYNLGE